MAPGTISAGAFSFVACRHLASGSTFGILSAKQKERYKSLFQVMHTITSCTISSLLCALFTFLYKPGDTKVWLTLTNDNMLRFAVPVEERRGGYAYAGLMLFGVLYWLYFAYSVKQFWILLQMVPLGIACMCLMFYLFSFSQITLNLKERTYEAIFRYPWRTRFYKGSLNDFSAVYISDRNSVSFAYKKLGPGLMRVIPIGSAGFGKEGMDFAQEVGRRTKLEVVTKPKNENQRLV